MYNVGIGDVVFIKKDIYEYANECHPGSVLGFRGDVVVIRTNSHIVNPESWLVSHPSRTDNCFRVSRDEIMVHDPLITHNDKQEYMKRHKNDQLEFEIFRVVLC